MICLFNCGVEPILRSLRRRFSQTSEGNETLRNFETPLAAVRESAAGLCNIAIENTCGAAVRGTSSSLAGGSGVHLVGRVSIFLRIHLILMGVPGASDGESRQAVYVTFCTWNAEPLFRNSRLREVVTGDTQARPGGLVKRGISVGNQSPAVSRKIYGLSILADVSRTRPQ